MIPMVSVVLFLIAVIMNLRKRSCPDFLLVFQFIPGVRQELILEWLIIRLFYEKNCNGFEAQHMSKSSAEKIVLDLQRHFYFKKLYKVA